MNFYLLFIKLWVKNLISLKAISSILSSFGSLWLFLEITSFFLGNSFTDKLKGFWFIFIFLIAGIIIAIFICIPKLSYGCKLNNRDIHIELAIGDLFNYESALIIGSNTTFDTKISHELISDKSIQGQFTKKYYADEKQLDKEINFGLQNITSETLSEERIGKYNKYPIGTVVRLNPNRTAYIIAITHINEHGVASGTFEELKQALANLWIFISQRGLKETIVMPIIGSGFSRLSQSREEIVREIIKSFVAACSMSTFCDKLIIVIRPEDIEKNKINLNELENYITHICKYTTFASNNIQTGISV